MAVANTLSTQVSNLDASPVIKNDVNFDGGSVRRSSATVEVAAADDNGSVYRFVRLPSDASVFSIKVFCDAITSGTVYDAGLYQTAENGGAVANASVYGSNVDLSSANTTGIEVAFEQRAIENVNKKIYEDLGLSTDPKRFYDLCLTGDTVGTVAGTISVVALWTRD